MNTYSVNKLIIALITAILLFVAVRAAGERLFPEEQNNDLAYVIDLTDDESEPSPAAATEATPAEVVIADAAGYNEPESTATASPALLSVATLVAQSDPAAGEKQTAICRACHDLTKGGPNKMGPNLWGIVSRKKASVAGFSYSAAFQSLSGAWTYEDLDAFLENPGQFAPGTKMSFAGVKDPENRAALIAYLRQQADTPAPAE